MTQFFQFESDFVESLRCIPMQVRFKLDTCGIKLKLQQWHQFADSERLALVEQPCATPEERTAYRNFLAELIHTHTGQAATELPIDAHPAWLEEAAIPESVTQKAEAVGTTVTGSQWANLTPLQRFALIKLSRSGHENSNFLPALQEFKLL